MNIDVYLNSIIMRELKFLNKFLYKYRIKLIVGFFITVAARIFALASALSDMCISKINITICEVRHKGWMARMMFICLFKPGLC